MNFPTDLRYTDNDEWVRVEGKLGRIGITDYAQDQLSDIVYIEVTVDEGDTVAQGDVFAAVESVKAAADVYMPMGGTIISINESLADTPEVMNSDPYAGGWIVEFELADPTELEALKDAAAYEAYCQERDN